MKNSICFFVFGFPPDFSGATTQAIKLAHALKNKGVDCSFISYTYDKRAFGSNVESDFPLKRYYRPRASMFRYHMNALKALYSCRNDFDTLYINGNDGQFWTAAYLAIFCKIFHKKIFMELNMEYEDPLSIFGTALATLKLRASKLITGYICLSTIIERRMRETYPTLPSHLLFNGVDIDIFKPAGDVSEKKSIRKKLGLNSNDKIVVACGAICKRKGIDFLLNAWKQAIRNIDNGKILFLGPLEGGADDSIDGFALQMKERSEQKDFFGSVVFCGRISNVEEYFKAADLLVFAGRQEGSPNVLREAMSSSLPIITLELEGITEDMITNGVNGIVIPVADQKKLRNYQKFDVPGETTIEDFASGITKLLNDEKYSADLAEEARKTAVNIFSLDEQARQLKSLISK